MVVKFKSNLKMKEDSSESSGCDESDGELDRLQEAVCGVALPEKLPPPIKTKWVKGLVCLFSYLAS